MIIENKDTDIIVRKISIEIFKIYKSRFIDELDTYARHKSKFKPDIAPDDVENALYSSALEKSDINYIINKVGAIINLNRTFIESVTIETSTTFTSTGIYDPATGEINIYLKFYRTQLSSILYGMLGNSKKLASRIFNQYIFLTLVHEVKHAFDNAISGSKTHDHTKELKYNQLPYDKKTEIQYQHLPSEIRARYSELINTDVVIKLSKNTDSFNEFFKKIKYIFKLMKLNILIGNSRKIILKRLYIFWLENKK